MSALSPAQIQERRNAARARWNQARQAAEIAAGAGIGGAAGASVGGHIVGRLRQAALDDKGAALDPLRGAFRQHKQNQLFIDQRAEAARSSLRSERNFTSNASRAFATKFRAASMGVRRLEAHRAVNSETYFDPTTGETVDATLDLPGETRLRDAADTLGADQAERFRTIAADLAANGKAPRKVPRAGYIAKPKVETFFRIRRGKSRLVISGNTRALLEDIFARDAEQRTRRGNDLSHLHDLGIKSIADLEAYMQQLSPASRASFAKYLRAEIGVPKLTTVRPKYRSDVTNAVRVVPAGKTTIPGYPSPDARKKLRAELLADITARQTHKTILEGQRAEAEMVEAKRIAAAAGRSLRALRPGGFGRRSIIGTGIAAGILAGAFAARRVQEFSGEHVHNPDLRKYGNAETAKRLTISAPRLTKVSPDSARSRVELTKVDDGDDGVAPGAVNGAQSGRRLSTPKRLLAAADNAEADLAKGVARAMSGWKAAVTPESVASPNAPGALFDQLDGPLYEGMAPMDRATSAGLTAPSRIQPPGDDEGEGQGPKPRLLHFGFDLRSKAVEQYAKRYRYLRVRDITDAQRQNIKQIIVQATSKADPPAVIARKIRDVVGLTANQAQIVANYRTMLETGDPRALGYTLRDKRFDGTVKKALDDKKSLAEAQIDKMVDIYQRRFIAYRAMMIARTEAIRAANNAHMKTVTDWLDKNPEYTVAKTWIATEDDKTRPDHRGLHRKTVIGMQTPFVCDSGETIRWPHDPDAAAKEVVACRCGILTVIIPRSAAAKHGPAAYGTPTPNYWEGPRPVFDIDDPDELFGNPELQPA